MDERAREITNERARRALRWAAVPAGVALAFTITVVLVGSAGARIAVAPSNTSVPTISGTPTQGQVLTAATGSWSGSAPIAFSYTWSRCDAIGGNCHDAPLGGTATYTLVSPDVGNTMRVAVTATNADGASTVTSVPTAMIAAAPGAPANNSPPTIGGTAVVGQVLTAAAGSWSGSGPISYSYTWQRCDATGGGCGTIGGATQPTYTLVSADLSSTLRVAVTATNAGGSKSETSVPTAVVAAATVTPPPSSSGCATSGGTVSIANVTSPAHLTIDQFQVTPSTITYGTRSLTARFHVSACGGSVQGALVYVTAVPYGMFAATNEQVTGADGWATVDLTALSGFPVSQKQQLLVMFVRARKSGEDILGGISARRLVSFNVSRG